MVQLTLICIGIVVVAIGIVIAKEGKFMIGTWAQVVSGISGILFISLGVIIMINGGFL